MNWSGPIELLDRRQEQRVVLDAGQPAHGHHDRPLAGGLIQRLSGAGRDHLEVHGVMQHAQLRARHAVARGEIVRYPLRGDDDGVGPAIEETRHPRKHPPAQRLLPREIRILEKARRRRPLVEDNPRGHARQPHGDGGDEVTEKRHDDVRLRGPQKARQLEEPRQPRALGSHHDTHAGGDAVEVDPVGAAEEIQHSFVPRVERAQHRHRHALGAAAGQRGNHEADLHATGGTPASVR